MNKEQFAYQAGRMARSVYVDPLMALLTLYAGSESFQSFSLARENPNGDNIARGAVFALGAGLTGLWTLLRVISRSKSFCHSREIERNMDDYPLEYAKRVIINDGNGVDSLLDRTGYREKKRWGTFLKVHDDHGIAVIDKILDIDQGIEMGIIHEGRRGGLYPVSDKASDMGFNGRQLYEPDIGPDWFGANNYAVGCFARFTPDNWINLRTFNIPGAQEIIAYNRNNVYLPTGNKTEFFLAGPERVMQYLRR